MTTLQAMAHAANVLLVVCAWHFPRLRAYAAAHLALDLARLGLGLVPIGPRPFVGVDFALLLLDAALLLVEPVALAWAMRMRWAPVAAFVSTIVLCVGQAYPTLHGQKLENVYVCALLTAHVYLSAGAALSRSWRANVDVDGALLLGLAVAGLVGASVVSAWPSHWELVQAGNVLAYLLTCSCGFLLRKRKNGHEQLVESEHRS